MSDEREKAIRERAYALWEKSGSPHGQHGEHWDQAVREIDAEAGAAAKPVGEAKAKPASKAKPVAKPKAVAAPPSAAKPAKAAPKAAAAPKAKVAPVPKRASAPAATAVGKAKLAADKVVATVKRATQGTAKK